MKTVELHETADSKGVLHLEVPVEQPHHRYRVVVTVEEERTSAFAKKNWPAGFIERTAGQWIGDFDIGSEGDYEERQSL
jgi:hypothetical protein